MLDRDGRCSQQLVQSDHPMLDYDAPDARASFGCRTANHSSIDQQEIGGPGKISSNGLRNTSAAQAISNFREGIATAPSMEAVRFLEARAGHAYWSAWRALPVFFRRTILCGFLTIGELSGPRFTPNRIASACGESSERPAQLFVRGP